jgi:hypothetical protein
MGVEITLTDKQFPVSPVFIDFLHRYLHGQNYVTTWHDQLNEALNAPEGKFNELGEAMAAEVLDDPVGKQAIFRSYEFLTAILTGDVKKVEFFRERYQFICVVGCPRHGGSYLTKQLFLALGMDADEVPNVIAHDGFPDASPFELREGYNSYTTMMQNMAEYFAMIELFFSNSRLFNNRVIVPKKATKAAYHGAFFNAMLGPKTEYIITLRHPVAACISTYEKSTGLPPDGKFKLRGNIEEWARRDNVFTGEDPVGIFDRDYFDVYLRYWEQYHYQLALGGLAENRNWRLVVYGEDRMTAQAQGLYDRFKSRSGSEKFHIFDKRDQHAEWRPRAEQAILRVRDVWARVGLSFPVDEIREGW